MLVDEAIGDERVGDRLEEFLERVDLVDGDFFLFSGERGGGGRGGVRG